MHRGGLPNCQAARRDVRSPGSQHLRQRCIVLNASPGINVQRSSPGNCLEHRQIYGLARPGSIQVDQMQTAHSRISKTLGYGHRVSVVSGLTSEVAGT